MVLRFILYRILYLGIPILVVLQLTLSCASSESSLRVMAASSLTEVFQEIAKEFESTNKTTVSITTAGSSSLASQIEDGAQVDVVALADEETMRRVEISGSLNNEDPRIFATNHLVLATPTGNPRDIATLEDLEGKVVAICSEQVPCGKLSYELADKYQIELRPSTFEPNVRSVRTKIELGEVDAGLIYITDVTEKIEYSPIVGADQVITNYPIASTSSSNGRANDFITFVLSPSGQRILRNYGFGAAP